jgi:amidase
MGPSLPTLKLVFKSLLTTEPWLRDPDVIKKPWQDHDYEGEDDKGGMSFGIIKSNDIARPHPPIARAIQMCADALRRKQHNVNISYSGLPNPG